MHQFRFLLLLVSSFWAVGCASYMRSAFPVLTVNKTDYSQAPSWAKGIPSRTWWRDFGDTKLNDYVEEALRNNADLAVLLARLNEAQSQIDEAKAQGRPSLVASLGYQWGQQKFLGAPHSDVSPWVESANAGWEIDLFGRVRNTVSAAENAANAAYWDIRGGHLAVAAQTAEAYIRILRLAEEYHFAAQSAQDNRDILKVMTARQQAGILSGIELERQKAETEKLDRLLLDLDRDKTNSTFVLERLLGREAGKMKPGDKGLERLRLPDPPEVLPADMLRRRPDILAAEARVRSAFDVEESARLDLFPKLTLGGSTSGQSNTLLKQFDSYTSIIGPSLEIPIYDPARLARRETRRHATEEAAQQFRRVVLQAFVEIETAYNDYVSHLKQLAYADREVSALDQARRLTMEKLQAGVVSQLELLESERSHLDAERERTALKQSLLVDWISLVKAVGG